MAEEKKNEEKIRWGGRLLGKTEADMSKAVFKQRPLQLEKTSEFSHELWMVAVVILGIAVSLNQLVLVEYRRYCSGAPVI